MTRKKVEFKIDDRAYESIEKMERQGRFETLAKQQSNNMDGLRCETTGNLCGEQCLHEGTPLCCDNCRAFLAQMELGQDARYDDLMSLEITLRSGNHNFSIEGLADLALHALPDVIALAVGNHSAWQMQRSSIARLRQKVRELESNESDIAEIIGVSVDPDSQQNIVTLLASKYDYLVAEVASLQSSLQSSESARQAAEQLTAEFANYNYDYLSYLVSGDDADYSWRYNPEGSSVFKLAAEYLVTKGRLEKHPTNDWYRLLPQESEVKGR